MTLIFEDTPLFLGNQSGIASVKPDDYTIVGNPIITDEGIASGFSTSNFLYSIGEYDFSGNFRLEISDIMFSTVNASIGICQVQGNGASININENWGEFRVELFDGTNRIIITTSTGLHSNTLTSLIVEVENGIAVITAQQDNVFLTKTADISSLDMTKFYDSRLMIGKTAWVGDKIEYINLNKFKVYVDGSLVYQPCLKIPYTLNEYGFKKPDTEYKDRVIEAYNQGLIEVYFK